ncbi:MAG: DDE-type integrase/transposase/recombinase [Fermentimonas sp.]|nr:DDE-type integrase/transposase/recombinase [Fermentimonas sp.]
MIHLNAVLQNVITEENKTIQRNRIIWVTPDNEYVYLINLEGDGSFPFVTSMDEIEIGLETGDLIYIKDPYAKILNDEDISSKQKDARERDWEVVQFLWGEKPETMLSRKSRAPFIKQASAKFALPEQKVKRILKRFWQRGMTKNALLMDYSNCGHKGLERRASKKKLGRPSKYREPGKEGININDEIKKIFRQVIDNHYRTSEKPNLMATYRFMLEKYFSNSYKDKNGEQKVKIWSKDRIPTYHQFYYWYRKEYDFKKDYITRFGENAFNLNHRELLGNPMGGILGPGSVYEVDATVADVYLVSSKDPLKVIGRPIVYVVIDAFSRMVTGLYVGLEGPSWIGAMMVLDNLVENKVEFCGKYGIEIEENEWPCEYLPEKILADNGEFEGYNADRLITNLHVKISNTPPYRGDLKGIVERHFRTVNDRIKYTSPGAVQREYRRRCDEDPRLKATYTLGDFIKFMIIDVLWHNKHINKSYPLTDAMIADHVLPRPIDVWNWGIKNRKGRFNTFPRDIVRLNLLPIKDVPITRSGIRFEDRFYSLDRGIYEGWFTTNKKKRIKIAYDPRNVNSIYLPNASGNSFEVANLLENSYLYKDLCWEEARFLRDLKREMQEEAKQDDLQNDADRDLATEAINKEAKKRLQQAEKTQPKQSKNKKTKEVKSNRAEEKSELRELDKFELGDNSPQTTGKVLPFNSQVDRNIKAKSNNTELKNDPDSFLTKFSKFMDDKLGKDEN